MKTAATTTNYIVECVSLDPRRATSEKVRELVANAADRIRCMAGRANLKAPKFTAYVTNVKASKFDDPRTIPNANTVFVDTYGASLINEDLVQQCVVHHVIGLGVNAGTVATVYFTASSGE